MTPLSSRCPEQWQLRSWGKAILWSENQFDIPSYVIQIARAPLVVLPSSPALTCPVPGPGSSRHHHNLWLCDQKKTSISSDSLWGSNVIYCACLFVVLQLRQNHQNHPNHRNLWLTENIFWFSLRRLKRNFCKYLFAMLQLRQNRGFPSPGDLLRLSVPLRCIEIFWKRPKVTKRETDNWSVITFLFSSFNIKTISFCQLREQLILILKLK